MNFLPDSLAPGLVFLLGGIGILLAMEPDRHRPAQWLVGYFFVVFTGVPAAGLDVPVPWTVYSEICLTTGVFLCVIALVRYARKELGEGEYD